SPEKVTGLGRGHFITVASTFVDGDGETVGGMRFRTLRFRPKNQEPTAEAEHGNSIGPLIYAGDRPKPGITRDNEFFFTGAAEGRLLILRCDECSDLIHPPAPHCPHCGSFDQTPAEMSGSGTIHSYVITHHPKVRGFDYPLAVALVDLDEGVRIITGIVDADTDDIHIGHPVRATFRRVDDDLVLPLFELDGGKER